MVSDDSTFNALQTALRNPLVGLVIVFSIALIFMALWGLAGLGLGLVLILFFVVVLVVLKQPNQKQQLSEERARLLQELSIAEKKMMRRELSRDLFESIAREKQARLVEIDALLTSPAIPPTASTAVAGSDKLEILEARRRHTLKALLEEQSMAKQVLKVANQKFLKHQIDDRAFERLTREKQEELLLIEAKIADVYRDEARDIVKRAKNRLKSADDSFSQESTVTEQMAAELQKEDEEK